MSQEERERRYREVTTRITLLEDAMGTILKRLGASDEQIIRWRRSVSLNSDITQMHASMNEILARLKPPPRR